MWKQSSSTALENALHESSSSVTQRQGMWSSTYAGNQKGFKSKRRSEYTTKAHSIQPSTESNTFESNKNFDEEYSLDLWHIKSSVCGEVDLGFSDSALLPPPSRSLSNGEVWKGDSWCQHSVRVWWQVRPWRLAKVFCSLHIGVLRAKVSEPITWHIGLYLNLLHLLPKSFYFS